MDRIPCRPVPGLWDQTQVNGTPPVLESHPPVMKTTATAAKVVLRKGRDVRVKAGHPWVFSGEVYQIPSSELDGHVIAESIGDAFQLDGVAHGSGGGILGSWRASKPERLVYCSPPAAEPFRTP